MKGHARALLSSVHTERHKKNCSCGQNLPELKSAKEQSFNLPLEITVSSGEQSL
ncbi:MAG: hypothetical protein LN575_02990 [Rickettsia endosymbiont of Gnoriste bilineata]|nr:hypothetical protein [Rickettsia endosymbiont of Gnoriste bilineata]